MRPEKCGFNAYIAISNYTKNVLMAVSNSIA